MSSAVLGAGTAFFFVLAYIVFMAADAGGFGGLVQRFSDSKAGVIESLTRFSKAVRKYLMVNTVFGAIVAVLDGIVLIVLGVPGTAAVGHPGLRHQLHPQHRVRHRAHPTGSAGAVDRGLGRRAWR